MALKNQYMDRGFGGHSNMNKIAQTLEYAHYNRIEKRARGSRLYIQWLKIDVYLNEHAHTSSIQWAPLFQYMIEWFFSLCVKCFRLVKGSSDNTLFWAMMTMMCLLCTIVPHSNSIQAIVWTLFCFQWTNNSEFGTKETKK